MITFPCPNCGTQLQAGDELAGAETHCASCGATPMVPFDLACDEAPVSPASKTITLEELKAMRRAAEQQAKG
jgi:hypothetical protein